MEWVVATRSLSLTLLLYHLLLGIRIIFLFVVSIFLSSWFLDDKFLMHPFFNFSISAIWISSKFSPRSIRIQKNLGKIFSDRWGVEVRWFHENSSQDLLNSNGLSVQVTFGFCCDGSKNFLKLFSVSWEVFFRGSESECWELCAG